MYLQQCFVLKCFCIFVCSSEKCSCSGVHAQCLSTIQGVSVEKRNNSVCCEAITCSSEIKFCNSAWLVPLKLLPTTLNIHVMVRSIGIGAPIKPTRYPLKYP